MKLKKENSFLKKVREENNKKRKIAEDKEKAFKLFNYLDRFQNHYKVYVYFWEVLKVIMQKKEYSRALYYMETKLQQSDYAIAGFQYKPSPSLDSFAISYQIGLWNYERRSKYPSKYTLKELIIREISDKKRDEYNSKKRDLQYKLKNTETDKERLVNSDIISVIKGLLSKNFKRNRENNISNLSEKINTIKEKLKTLKIEYKKELAEIKKY